MPLALLVAAPSRFETETYPALTRGACRSCHQFEGVAATTRLQFPEPDASPEKVAEFGRALATFVNAADPAQSLLVRKPTGRTPHAGGVRFPPGSAEDKALQAWAAELARLSPAEIAEAKRYWEREAAGGGHAAPRVALRRLTHSQYNNVVRDLLGDTSRPANQFPPEDYINGFKGQYQGQSISPLLMEAYSAAAEKLARNAFRNGDTRKLLPCASSAATASCRARFVETFGRKAFRRPLQPAETKRYVALMTRETDILRGAQLVVEAMLQSPSFLFRLEDTTEAALRPWATASRLSFALWDSMPDEALFTAAAGNVLSTPAAVRQAARRLLNDPRAQDNLDEFTSQWLRFDRVLGTAKDRRQYPKFNREAAVAMTEEARRFVRELVWKDRDFMELFTAREAFATPDLAAIYEIPAPAREYESVAFPEQSERAGILGQALFLASTAKPDDTSPTARGLFVREQFLCQHVPPPPAGVNTNLPPQEEGKPLSNRDRLQLHFSNPGCAGCHTLIDPIGFGLEKFDAIGGRREKQTLVFAANHGGDNPKRVEVELNTAGHIAGVPNSQFKSPRELGAILARTPACQDCMVKQFFRYVAGRMETPADRPLLSAAASEFRASRFRFKELMIAVVTGREFPATPPGGSHVARVDPAR